MTAEKSFFTWLQEKFDDRIIDFNTVPTDSDFSNIDDHQLISSEDSNLSFETNNNNICNEDKIDNSNSNNNVLNKKARHQNQACQTPSQKPKVGQEEGSVGGPGPDFKEEEGGPNLDFKKFIDNQLGTNTPFLKNSEQLCPSDLFGGLGLSPVCEEPTLTVMVLQANVFYSNLDNVFPRMSNFFFFFSFSFSFPSPRGEEKDSKKTSPAHELLFPSLKREH